MRERRRRGRRRARGRAEREPSARSAEPRAARLGHRERAPPGRPHTRARTLLLRLQRLHGNAAVERVIRSLQVTDAGRDARVQAIGERAGETGAAAGTRAALPRGGGGRARRLAYASKTERELVQDNVNTVGQIFSNYQAALHLLEEAVKCGYGETVPRAARARGAAGGRARGVHAGARRVRRRGAGARGPGGGEHREASTTYARSRSSEAGQSAPAHALRNLVIAERQRVATTHCRLIKRPARADEGGRGPRGDRPRRLPPRAGRRRRPARRAGDRLALGGRAVQGAVRSLAASCCAAGSRSGSFGRGVDASCERTSRARTGAGSPPAARRRRRLLRPQRPPPPAARGLGAGRAGALRGDRRPPRASALRFDRNERGAPFEAEFQRRLRTDGLPRTKVLSGD